MIGIAMSLVALCIMNIGSKRGRRDSIVADRTYVRSSAQSCLLLAVEALAISRLKLVLFFACHSATEHGTIVPQNHDQSANARG